MCTTASYIFLKKGQETKKTPFYSTCIKTEGLTEKQHQHNTFIVFAVYDLCVFFHALDAANVSVVSPSHNTNFIIAFTT